MGAEEGRSFREVVDSLRSPLTITFVQRDLDLVYHCFSAKITAMSIGLVVDIAHATVGAYAALRTLKESSVIEDAARPAEDGYDVVGTRGESPEPAARNATARWLQFWTMYGLATAFSSVYSGTRGNVLAVPILA